MQITVGTGRPEIDNSKCMICGYRKNGVELKNAIPICSWCSDPKFYEILSETIAELEEQITKSNFIDTTSSGNSALFCFVADMGMASTEHPFLNSLRRVLGAVISQVGGKGITDLHDSGMGSSIALEDLIGVARFRDVARFLGLLKEMGLIELPVEGNGGADFVRRVKAPEGGLISKIAATTEAAVSADDPKLDRGAAFALGYVTLLSMKRTIELVKRNGHLYYGEAITKLYPIDKNGRIMVVKGYMAPIAFIFGQWAHATVQFTEYELQRFLGNRGLMGRYFQRVVNWMSGGQTSSVQLLYTKQPMILNGVPVYRFTLNTNYQKLRDRIQQRIRQRERERTQS